MAKANATDILRIMVGAPEIVGSPTENLVYSQLERLDNGT
jgi:hypothetical protein